MWELVIGMVPVYSKSEWMTPYDLFDELNAEFGFTLDPCSTHDNALCHHHFTIIEDGLERDWYKDIAFVHPPYNCIDLWIRKSYRESLRGSLVVCLLPAYTDKLWFHDYAMLGEIRFIRDRLLFRVPGGLVKSPFPSMIVVYGATF